jgi:ribosomal protein S18 acetylase RimI-like enzyme
MTAADLPRNHTFRPANPADAESVLAVVIARDVADIGRPDFTLEDVRADWSAPGVDLGRDARVVEDDTGRIVAYALLLADDAQIFVHPDACGRGIGTALRTAAEERARERGTAVLRQFIPTANEDARALLLEAGYWPAQHYWRMRIALEDAPPAPPVELRSFEREVDEPAVHALVEGAFADLEGYTPEPLEAWRTQRIDKDGWDPALWLLLEDGDGLVGAALGERWDGGVGYVAQLAVDPRARGHGHGRVLLLGLLGAFRAAGLEHAELSVHGSNQGAARLYESIGMASTWEAERWEKALGH